MPRDGKGQRRLSPQAEARLRLLSPAAREELLMVLTSGAQVRADVIRQFHERGADLAEVLMDLEGDDLLRRQVVDALRYLDARDRR